MTNQEQGWSWPGFFFTGIWAIVKEMWAPAVCWFVVVVAMASIALSTDVGPGAGALINIIGLVVSVIFGSGGNAWRGKNLISRGFSLVGLVTAPSPAAAVEAGPKDAI